MAIRYDDAPISEALIDIQIETPRGLTLAALESLWDQVRDRYPGKKKRVDFQGRISVGAEVGAATSQQVVGFVFSSNDGKQICQARLNGFTFSRLRPYGTWNELRDEARRLWGTYSARAKPSKITRVAVRYINRIDIPFARIDYKNYFRTTPEVSPDLPQALSGFFMQLQFPQEDFGGQVVLTQAAAPPPTSNPLGASVILDIDAFKENAEITADEALWELLELLRKRKNEFFEGCITDETRSLFGRRRKY